MDAECKDGQGYVLCRLKVIMYQDMKHKKCPWIRFLGDELVFRCDNCGKESRLKKEEEPKEEAAFFAQLHQNCERK